MAYGLKYTTYKVVGDTRYTLRIYQKDYNGASFGIGTLTGFSLQIQGDQSSLIAPIIKTSVNISLKDFFNRGTTQSGVTCIEDGEKMGQWEEFYTRDPLKYRIDVLVGASNPTTIWSGYLTPDSWGEEMQYGGDINLTARDMLGYLDEQEFDLTGRTTIQNLIQSAITKSQSAMAVAFKTTDCLYNSNGQSILAATIDASTYSGQTWYQALEKCLESLGLVLRYNGDNGFFVTSLRYLISYTHEYSTAVFTGRSGYRTLDPAVKQIVEVFDPKIEAYIAPDPANDAYTEVTGQYVTEEPFFNGTISTHYVPKYTLPLPSGIEGWNGNLAVPAMYTLSDDAPKRTMFFPTDVTTGEVAYYRNSALKAPFILNIGCDALCYMYNGRIYPSNGNGFAQKVEKVLVHITCSVGGTTYGLAANGEWSAGNGEQLEVALDADFNVPACENGTNYILKVDNIATHNLHPVEHAYLAALTFGFSPADANDLAGEYKTTTKYNENNHTEISRDPSIGSATSTMVSLPMVKNILGYGNDIATDAWKFYGDNATFPLAVMIHAQIIVYYGQMEDSQGRETGNSIFTGNFIDSQQTPLVPSTRYTYFGKTCTLLSGAYNFLTGGVDSATLREFFTWSSVWDTFDPQYSVKTSRNEGGTASAGGGGSASGGGGSTGGSVTSVDMSVPTGMTIGGNPITTRGTLALGLAEGYNFLTDSYKAALDGHLGSSSNPHNVTWAQVNSASGDNKIQTAYIGDGQVTLAKLAQGIRDILDLFEKDTTSVAGQTLIHAKYALYSHEEITAGGIGSGGGGGSTFTAVAYANLAALTSEEMSKIPTAWAAKKLQDRIATLESTTPNVSWGTAGADYVPLNVNGTTKNLLTAHQSLSGYATTSALSAHTGDTTIHITASERSTWNNKQDAATAITTSNIGSQSVAYATSAGNADTLDSLHATSFAQYTEYSSPDNAYDFGFGRFAGGSGSPTGTHHGQFLTLPYRRATGNSKPDFSWQILGPNGDDPSYPDDIFVRTSLADSWRSWHKLYHSGNLTSSVIAALGALSNDTTGNAATSTTATNVSGGYCSLDNNETDWNFGVTQNRITPIFTVDGSATGSPGMYHYGYSFMTAYSGFQLVEYGSGNIFKIRGNFDGTWQSWHTLYHSGNCNNTSTPWSASSLTLNGKISGATTGEFSTYLLAGSIKLQYTDEINRYGGTLYLQHRGHESNPTGPIAMCDNGGNVGIGTASPSYKLHINGSGSSNIPTIYNVNNGNDTWIYSYAGFAPNLSTNYHLLMGLGTSMSMGNMGWIGYNNAGAASSDNCISFGFLSKEWILNCFFNGGVTIGTFDTTNYARTNGVALYVSGNVLATGEITAGSDLRWKENIASLTDYKSILNALSPVEWDWKEGHGNGHSCGFIAQDIADIMPYAVKGNEKDGYTLNYNTFHAVWATALRNHETRVEYLERRVKELENRIAQLS